MRLFLASSLLASSLALGGCVTTGIGTGGGGFLDTVTSIVAKAQQLAEAGCGYIPAAADLAAIFAAGDPAVTTASAVAKAFCSAVTRKSVVRGRVVTPTITVRGRDGRKRAMPVRIER